MTLQEYIVTALRTLEHINEMEEEKDADDMRKVIAEGFCTLLHKQMTQIARECLDGHHEIILKMAADTTICDDD